MIGGGINGTAIARDAAGRGLRVVLLEAQDLGAGMSSMTSKLLFSGLRYLERGEARLVKDALAGCRDLADAAPQAVQPMRFVVPYAKKTWPEPKGRFIRRVSRYDVLGRTGGRAAGARPRLPRMGGLDLRVHPAGDLLQAQFQRGISYTDYFMDDSRLVILNAMDAAARGAEILPRTPCTGITSDPETGGFVVRLPEDEIRARRVVNAAGPWARDILMSLGEDCGDLPEMRYVRGAHIVVPRLSECDAAYLLPQPGRRLLAAVPYEEDYTLLGWTDFDYAGDPMQALVSDDEADDLLGAAARYFREVPGRGEIIWRYSGMRLQFTKTSGRKTVRTEVLHGKSSHLHLKTYGAAPLLSVFGGGFAGARALAQEAVDTLLGEKNDWTRRACLPGGEAARSGFDAMGEDLVRRYAFLPDRLVRRYAQVYGSLAARLLEDVSKPADLGLHYGEGVYEAEMRYLVQYEWARTPEDILWRRSKLGLHVSRETARSLDQLLPRLLREVWERGDMNTLAPVKTAEPAIAFPQKKAEDPAPVPEKKARASVDQKTSASAASLKAEAV